MAPPFRFSGRILLRLLLGASGEAAEAAKRQAQILVTQEPLNWSARATLGLARLRRDRNADAPTVFCKIRATGSEPFGALAVRAAILAVNGYEEGGAAMRIIWEPNASRRKKELLALRCLAGVSDQYYAAPLSL